MIKKTWLIKQTGSASFPTFLIPENMIELIIFSPIRFFIDDLLFNKVSYINDNFYHKMGDKSIPETYTNRLLKCAENLKWDISNYRIVEVDNEEEAGDVAAAICGNGEADILMKGDLHSDVFMRSVISRKNNLGDLIIRFFIFLYLDK